jgi:hypothetical protein
MRTTTTNRWVWVFAGALPVAGLGAGCGDDTTDTGTTSGAGGFGGFGGGDATQASSSAGTPTSSSSGGNPTSSSSSGTPSSSSSSGDGGSGTGGDPGEGGGGSGQGGSPSDCGNGLLDDGEACDGDQLGDATCDSEGFFAGTISCTDDCQLDTSECTNCGNDEQEDDEECDGGDLDGNDCTDIGGGFIGGTLACANDCTFDTIGCVNAECGDNEVNGNEECEVGMLGGETCVTQDFVSGTPGCTNCQYDTSTCVSCGDDEITGDDVCDGTDLGAADCTTVPGNFTGGTLGCDNDCAGYDDTLCTSFPQPGLGEIVITEMMMNPTGTPTPFPDDTAEWFEVTNPSASTTFQLRGCVVSTRTEAPFTITSDLSIAPGDVLTFAKSDPGFTADYTYPNAFNLANGVNGDFLTITCDGVEVDTVDYNNAGGWTVPAGASLSLNPDATATENNLPGAWCSATTIGGGLATGDFGTPGVENPACGAGNFTIDFCRLQAPLTISETEGTAVTVYGRVFVAGLTDQNTAGNDPNALVVAALGYGTDGSLPDTWTNWTAAMPNAGYVTGAPGFEPNNDEYQATFNVPPAAGSPYDYAYRFSGDGGTTWVYCDSNGEPFASADAGQMTSEPSTVDYDLYFSQYLEGTAGTNKALEIYNAGDATIDLGACQLRLYRNGASTFTAANTLQLEGTIAAGGTFVLCSETTTDFGGPNGNDACDVNVEDDVAMDFNGDDALELVCASSVLDVIGAHTGTDPGTAWGTNPTDTLDVNLQRICPHVPDTDGTDAFDPTVAWIGTNYDAGTAAADLGSYTCD